jgi:hypothetical protein
LIKSDGTTQLGVWGGEQCSPSLPVGIWTHIVMTFDGTTLKSYENGIQTCSTPAIFNLSGIPLTLAQAHGSENYFNGTIDEVRIYSRALTAQEVTDHYNGRYTNESGLVLLQHFEEGPTCKSGPCLSDDSGNNNNGTPSGFTNLSDYDDVNNPNSGWTRSYPSNRSVFIGGLDGDPQKPSSCPDSKLPCGNKNVIGNYYYNTTVVPGGFQRPNGKNCESNFCIDSSASTKD